LVTMEESYIYTEEAAFHTQLQKLFADPDGNGGVQPRHMRALLQAYFETSKHSIKNSMPKAIMLCLVQASQKQLTGMLFENIASASTRQILVFS